MENEVLDETSLEGLSYKYLEQFDFVLDFSAIARNIEYLVNYSGYHNYGVFRNGYNGYTVPRLRLVDRHYICPSYANKKIFESHGFPEVHVAYYGIPSFYSPSSVNEPEFPEWFAQNNIEPNNYFLFGHRPTEEKGSYHVLQLAQMFPNENFVYMVSNNPVQQHKSAMQDLKKKAIGLPNIKFVELPLHNKHHYYKRDLMRFCKAGLSPFNPAVYLEGFGLTNAEIVANGRPILITDSESSRELWVDEKDGLILPYDDRMSAFRMAIKHFESYSFDPTNKFTVSDCISNYEKYINEMMGKQDNGVKRVSG